MNNSLMDRAKGILKEGTKVIFKDAEGQSPSLDALRIGKGMAAALVGMTLSFSVQANEGFKLIDANQLAKENPQLSTEAVDFLVKAQKQALGLPQTQLASVSSNSAPVVKSPALADNGVIVAPDANGLEWAKIRGVNGKPLWVTADFVKDSQGDYVRASRASAIAEAKKRGARLPTRDETKLIWQQAHIKLKPQPVTGKLPTGSQKYKDIDDQRLAGQLAGVAGRLIAGNGKTMVKDRNASMNNLTYRQVAEFGWFTPGGKAIQSGNSDANGKKHGANYDDYSQKLRLGRDNAPPGWEANVAAQQLLGSPVAQNPSPSRHKKEGLDQSGPG